MLTPIQPVNFDAAGERFPEPIYKRRRGAAWLVWIIPLLTAIVAGLYVQRYFASRGPLVTIQLTSAEGIKVNDTPVLYRGVEIGRVSEIELSDNLRKALVKVRLKQKLEEFAKEGAMYWMVAPEVSGTEIMGLGTLLSGPYIAATPGKGDKKNEFTGLMSAPAQSKPGIEVMVYASRLDHLEVNSPVYYRGMQVGAVRSVNLGKTADRMEARLVVWNRYRALVRTGSKFWADGGFAVKGGLFSGIEAKLHSLKAMVSGGIAFATPEKEMGPPAKENSSFVLETDPKDDWLAWAPKISLQPGAPATETDDGDGPALSRAVPASGRANAPNGNLAGKAAGL